jgi:hypothetical protein
MQERSTSRRHALSSLCRISFQAADDLLFVLLSVLAANGSTS